MIDRIMRVTRNRQLFEAVGGHIWPHMQCEKALYVSYLSIGDAHRNFIEGLSLMCYGDFVITKKSPDDFIAIVCGHKFFLLPRLIVSLHKAIPNIMRVK